MHPRYLWCVDTPQDAAPSRARRGRWGGFVCAHARRALLPLPLSVKSRYAHCGSVYLCFYLGWRGGYTWFVPPHLATRLVFCLTIVYFIALAVLMKQYENKMLLLFWELGVLTNKNQYAKQMVACQKESVANLRFVLHWTLGKSVCVATSPRRPMGNVLHEP